MYPSICNTFLETTLHLLMWSEILCTSIQNVLIPGVPSHFFKETQLRSAHGCSKSLTSTILLSLMSR
jgi:hypothetical protein